MEWKTNFAELPIGEPVMLCVNGLDGMKDYVIGPAYALVELDGGKEFYSVESRKRLPGLCVYAWAPWPKPLDLKKWMDKRL